MFPKKHRLLALFKVIWLMVGLLTPVSGDIVWEEDFEAGPTTDWEFQAYTGNGDSESLIGSKESLPRVEDGVLNMNTNSYLLSVVNPRIHFAFHPLTTAYGTWSLDFTTNIETRFFVMFMWSYTGGNNFSGITFADFQLNGYGLGFDTTNEGIARNLFLNEYKPGEIFDPPISQPGLDEDLTGSNHLDITRDDETGKIHVYLDNEQVINVDDTTHTTSEYFGLLSFYGDVEFDNIKVIDTQYTTDDEVPMQFWLIAPALMGLLVIHRRMKKSNSTGNLGHCE
jgi:hypothetical protein